MHRSETSLLLCYVDHHEQAYQWAERRKLETHPRTGAAQLVEIREKVVEIEVPRYVEAPKPPLFAGIADETLLGYGVPREWLADVHSATEDSLLELADHLPSEAAEALLELATGAQPKPALVAAAAADPFEHPDALRRFRVMGNVEELVRALDYPWEKWTVFLHPDQRQLVERSYTGPARVSGSAGTGKTIVALHRAAFLARTHPDARVLLTTFSDALSNALGTKLRRLISNEPRLGERIEVHSMDSIGARLYELNVGPLRLAERETVENLLKTAAGKVPGQKFSSHFLLTEWDQVVDAWQLESWEAYRDVTRLGRKTRLSEKQRQVLWTIFADVRSELQKPHVTTRSGMFSHVAAKLLEQHSTPFDFAVVDEAQDVGIAQLRFLAALSGSAPNRLFFAGDLGQRIFQQPFSWKAVGVDVRGRSFTLRVNYRTSHQIRRQADRLLGPEVSDVDGNTEQRKGTVSLFNGPQPVIQVYKSEEEETAAAAKWLQERRQEGVQPSEIGIFVRSAHEVDRARAAAEKAGIPCRVLDERVETVTGRASISTMHLAKGLEFRSVVVMACDDEVIPSQDRIEAVVDDADLEEVYNTERHLLYVSCTRARDHLLVTSAGSASEFLEDLC